MVENKRDQIQEMKSQIGESEFMQTLSYYRLSIRRDSILCPLHQDKHYESCKIRKDRKSAYCFVCQKNIDSIDLVSHYEGYGFMDALIYLWTEILGRELPAIQKAGKRKKKFLSFDDLQFLGLAPKFNQQMILIENEIDRMDEVPEGYVADWKHQDEEGNIPIGKVMPRYSLYDLYEENPEVVLYMINSEIQNALSWYHEKLDEMKQTGNELGYLCKRDSAFAKEMRTEIWHKINYLNQMSTKLKKVAL